MMMQPVLTAEAMRAADAYTIDEFGISGRILMESAGRGAALAIDRRYRVSGKTVNVYCGKGNNGGDGFVIARYVYDRGAHVRVVALGTRESMTEDAGANYDLLRRLDDQDSEGRLLIDAFEGVDSIPSADIHIDALLGTGVTSDLREPLLSLVSWLNGQPGARVAIDIPTGLHTDLGLSLGATFDADVTLTIGALKSGLLVNAGPGIAGDVEVIDIGIPRFALEGSLRNEGHGSAWLSSDEAVRSWLPARSSDANKYSVGLALVVAGSAGMTGAPVMASKAAARIGAGYVVCACDFRIQSTLGVKMTEVTTIPLPASEVGIDQDSAMNALNERLGKAQGVLIGCGLGRDPGTQSFIRRFLEEVDAPLVIDADGLNALAGHMHLAEKHSNGRWILTPHMGEFKRLAEADLDDVEIDPDDRIALAQHFAKAWNCILLLKGLPSVVATPSGETWINATGGTALASAGTGDVLAGICTGLLAQGLAPEHAAVAALHIGGAAADRYAARVDGRSLQATDITNELPALLKERFPSAH